MDTFDAIEVRRPALAASYLQLLAAQPGRPIALFAPRRVGKTFFLDHDLAPAARKAGLLPVYADVWLHRAAPLDAINHALEEALDDATVPAGRIGRIAQTPVKKVGRVLGGHRVVEHRRIHTALPPALQNPGLGDHRRDRVKHPVRTLGGSDAFAPIHQRGRVKRSLRQ